jgi:thymidylate synthase
MKQFLDFMRHVRRNGAAKADRTGTGTLSVFGYQMRFDLAAGFPLVTTKRVHFKSIAYELLWFREAIPIRNTCASTASALGRWADENGVSPGKAAQWRSWPRPIFDRPDCRLPSSCGPTDPAAPPSAPERGELDQMKLMPRHAFFQFHVGQAAELSALSAQRRHWRAVQHRSYAAHAHARAATRPQRASLSGAGKSPCESPQQWTSSFLRVVALPKLTIARWSSIFDYTFEDFIVNYQHHPAIGARRYDP